MELLPKAGHLEIDSHRITQNASILKDRPKLRDAGPRTTKIVELLDGDPEIGRSGPAELDSTLVALATAHLRSPHSKRAYRQAVVEFMEWCKCTGETKLSKAMVLDYMSELNRL